MISFTVDDVRKIMAEDKRFESDLLALNMDDEHAERHMAGISNCITILSTLRKNKTYAPRHLNVGTFKHIVESLSQRYTWHGEVLVAAKILEIEDDGDKKYPAFKVNLGDANKMRQAGLKLQGVRG